MTREPSEFDQSVIREKVEVIANHHQASFGEVRWGGRGLILVDMCHSGKSVCALSSGL